MMFFSEYIDSPLTVAVRHLMLVGFCMLAAVGCLLLRRKPRWPGALVLAGALGQSLEVVVWVLLTPAIEIAGQWGMDAFSLLRPITWFAAWAATPVGYVLAAVGLVGAVATVRRRQAPVCPPAVTGGSQP